MNKEVLSLLLNVGTNVIDLRSTSQQLVPKNRTTVAESTFSTLGSDSNNKGYPPDDLRGLTGL